MKIRTWTEGLPVDEKAMAQVRNTAALPFVWPHVALMADYHFGLGATVGSVVPTIGAIMPAAVGVDIGCSMSAVCTEMTKADLPELEGLRVRVGLAVPHGRSHNGWKGDVGAWAKVPEGVAEAWDATLLVNARCFASRPGLTHPFAREQLGTLGTGNHFIEVSLDEHDRVWAVVHSGSRGPGNRIGTTFIKLAKEAMKRWHITLPDPDLAYLPQGEPLFDEYWAAVQWAQRYAEVSHQIMMLAVLKSLGNPETIEEIYCRHNYVARERHFGKDLFVTRKGACSAREGEWIIVPGSMGAKTYIVQGKGNRESLTSCSHGAGRAMSRTAARKTFTVEDHVKATEGVVCDKSAGVLDETPGAYKNIDAVMKAQEDLVTVRHTLRQVVSVKGGGEE